MVCIMIVSLCLFFMSCMLLSSGVRLSSVFGVVMFVCVCVCIVLI